MARRAISSLPKAVQRVGLLNDVAGCARSGNESLHGAPPPHVASEALRSSTR